MPTPGAVVVAQPGATSPGTATIAAGAARSVELIEAQLRALNDRGKAVYYDPCVWGGPSVVGNHLFLTPGMNEQRTWIYDPAFPLGPQWGGLPIAVAIHRSQPAYAGLDAKYATAARDPFAFIALQFDTPCDRAAELFVFDAYEECRLALQFLASNAWTIASDAAKRPILCAEIGRYASCLYDCAARPTPAACVHLQNPFDDIARPDTVRVGATIGTTRFVRADAVEAAIGHALRDEDLLPGGAITGVYEHLFADAQTPWQWSDYGPATKTFTVTQLAHGHGSVATSQTIPYGGSLVRVVVPKAGGGFSASTVIASGTQIVSDAIALARYCAQHTMAQLLLAEWIGYTQGPVAAFQDKLALSATQLAKLQDDAIKAHAQASSQGTAGVGRTTANVVPILGQIYGALLDLFSGLPTASGVLDVCPPPFLIRVPSGGECPTLSSARALQDAVAGVQASTTAGAAESVHHDVPPPSFSFVTGFVKAKQDAATQRMWKIGAGVAAVAAVGGGLIWFFRRKR